MGAANKNSGNKITRVQILKKNISEKIKIKKNV